MNLDEMMRPVYEERDRLVTEEDALRDQLARVQTEKRRIDAILKAAGLSTNGAKKKETPPKDWTPSIKMQQRVLDFVNTAVETNSADVAHKLGISQSTAGKALSTLREDEQIRLLRIEPATEDGRGRRQIYAPWEKT